MARIDTVYVIAKADSLWYSPPATTAAQAWANFEMWERVNLSMMTRAQAKEKGYRARRVEVFFPSHGGRT